MAKLTALLLSDTHGHHRQAVFQTATNYDLLIHAGDFTNCGSSNEVDDFLQWLDLLTQFKDIIYIAGNHDIGYTSAPCVQLSNGTFLHYLHNTSVFINGVNIYGSPYTPRFFDWDFMYDPADADDIWSAIPASTNVLITHGPPHGIMDQCPDHRGKQTNAGCLSLLEAAKRLPALKLHVFGHIHEGHGMVSHPDGRVSVNAASICESVRHSPIEFDIDI